MRNLGLFFPDDRSAVDAPEGGLINQVNRTPFRWDEHCRDAAAQKELVFEMMSADINFALDASDPGRHSGAAKENSWGLVHALAGIARRQEIDGFGNRLPLAWEVRTISPDIFSADADATRIYGLLRALAAKPEEGESIEDCIRREYEEETLATGERKFISGEALLLRDIMIEDLAGRKAHTSNAMAAVGRLLPRWRSMFLRAVKNKDVSIQTDRAREIKKDLMAAAGPIPVATLDPVIPINNRNTHRVAYGLNLFSVMADVIADNALDVRKTYDAVTDSHGTATTVLEWYESLITAAEGKLSANVLAEQLFRLAKRAEESIKKKNVGEFLRSLNGQSLDRGMLLLILVAHSRLRGGPIGDGMKQLSMDYVFTYDFQTFTRPFRKYADILPKGTPQQAVRNLAKALQDDPSHGLGDRWIWIKDGLRRWYEDALELKAQGDQSGIRPEIARKRAPGLFAA